MEPEDALAFQAMIVHGSPGNTSSNRRRAAEVAIPTRDPGFPDGAPLDCVRLPVVRTETTGGSP